VIRETEEEIIFLCIKLDYSGLYIVVKIAII